MKETVVKEVELKDGISARLEEGVLIVKGSKGEVRRNFQHPKVQITIEDNKVVLRAKNATRREKTIIGSFCAHVKNMLAGVEELYVYKLKICSGHFPMNVTVSGKDFAIKNFLGEAVPRKLILVEGVDVKIDGTEIIVTSVDKELAGQVAANIESLCRITNRDRRIFQDGCYIINKAGKEINPT